MPILLLSRAHCSTDSQELVAGQLLVRACLVCRRWRNAVYSEPALWRAFTLRGDLYAHLPFDQQARWLAAHFVLLRRVGQHLQAFTAYACANFESDGAGAAGGWRLAQYLRLLNPSKLKALTIQATAIPLDACGAADMFEVVADFEHLTALRLGSRAPLPPCTGTVLQQLSGLQRLALDSSSDDLDSPGDDSDSSGDDLDSPGDDQPAPWLRSISQLRSLTYLSFCPGRLRSLDLAPLSQLRHLGMVGGELQPPGLAAFPLLTSYSLDHSRVSRPGCE